MLLRLPTRTFTYLFSQFFLALLLTTGLASCSAKPAAFGARGYTEEGKASYYSRKLQGRSMANGKPYRHGRVSVAHKTLPLGTKIKVTNLQNHQSIKARVTDRGPFVKGRIIDLSGKAAKRLDAIKAGVVPVKIKVLRPAASR